VTVRGSHRPWWIAGLVLLVIAVVFVAVAHDDEDQGCEASSTSIADAPMGASAEDALRAFLSDAPSELAEALSPSKVKTVSGNEVEGTYKFEGGFYAYVRDAEWSGDWHVVEVGRACALSPPDSQ
jgi:hypothetical protein